VCILIIIKSIINQICKYKLKKYMFIFSNHLLFPWSIFAAVIIIIITVCIKKLVVQLFSCVSQ